LRSCRPWSGSRAVVLNAQPVDEHINQPQHALLPSRLIVRVAHADKRAQQVFRADVVANFSGRDGAIEQAADSARQTVVRM
jgi:hypothetical protein